MISAPTIEKERDATAIIRSSLAHSKNPCVCFSGGKCSLVLTHIIRVNGFQAIPVIHIDTGMEFPEVNAYIRKMKTLWQWELVLVKTEETGIEFDRNPYDCCEKLKCKPLLKTINQTEFDCIFCGNTSDTTEIVSNMPSAYPGIREKIVQPLIGFNDDDIWHYIRAHNLPYCSLYDKGYVKIDCEPCSLIDSNPFTAPADVTDEKRIKEKLKKLGYL